MMKHFVLLLVALVCGVAAAAEVPFRLDASVAKEIWGGRARPRVFFDEQLPACFERTLQIDAWATNSPAGDWIFTGPRVAWQRAELCDPYALNLTAPAAQRFVPPGGILTLIGGK